MNIFQALSQGKSRLHEPSMSAMLGYLLDSNRDHGLGDAFVRQFLEAVDKERFRELLTRDFIDSQVSLEEPYELDNSRKDIDIQLLILDESKNENLYLYFLYDLIILCCEIHLLLTHLSMPQM